MKPATCGDAPAVYGGVTVSARTPGQQRPRRRRPRPAVDDSRRGDRREARGHAVTEAVLTDASTELLHEGVDDTDLSEGLADVVHGGQGPRRARVTAGGAHDGRDPLEAGDAHVGREHRTAPRTVEGEGEDFTIGDASVVCGNVQTANATVYVVDQVLMPEM